MAGALTGLTLAWTPGLGVLLTAALGALTWSRVHLHQRTCAQALAGAGIGLVIGAGAGLLAGLG